MYQVDFNDPERKRTPKQSSYFIRDVIETRIIPRNYVPISVAIEIITLWPRPRDGVTHMMRELMDTQ